MSEESSNINLCKEYLHEVYINENTGSIIRHLQENTLYYAEFGEALGGGGVKAHAQSWLEFFKVNNIEIKVQDATDRGVCLEYTQSVQQRGIFKGVDPTTKMFQVSGSVSMAISNQTIVLYDMRNDIGQLVLQLVDEDQEKYQQAMNTPIFSNPYDSHMRVIVEHLKENNILLSESQVKYLCAYFWGVTDDDGYHFLKLPALQGNHYEQEIKQLFQCSNRTQICNKLREMKLADLVMEGFSLLNMPSLSFYDAHQSHFGVSTSLTDSSRYLI